MLKSIWLYRGFIFESVKREFQSKYRNSILGILWAIINPLAMITVYTVIFSQVMQAKLAGIDNTFSYSIYLCSGIITWGLFSEIISKAQNIFIDNANLLKKISFPRLCLPIIVVLTALLNFLIIFSLFVIFLLITGNFPGWSLLAVLPVLIIQILFSISLGVFLGVLNVFFRDVGQLFSVVLQFWFWLTPIVYPITIIPEYLKPVMYFNPMFGLINSYQNVFVYGNIPEWSSLMPVIILTVFLGVLALGIFRKRSGEMMDE